MKRKILILLIIFLGVSLTGFSDIDRNELETKYRQAINYYYKKDYVQALTIFNEIQGIDPTFRASQIRRYKRTIEGRLGKLGVKKKFTVGEPTIKEVKIRKEGELEVLSKEAQKVLLDTYEFFRTAPRKYEISEFDMLEPESTLKMAKKAYDESQFTEAIRLANKARFQLEQLIQKKKEKEKVELGKIGKIPVTLNLTDADLEQTLKLIYDLTGTNIVMSKGIKGRVTINVKDLPLKKVLDLICEANGLKYLEEDGVIKIMTEEEYNKRAEVLKEQNRRVFHILYGDASAIAKSLRETFRTEKIVYDPRTNSIIVDVDNPAMLRNIQEVVSALDSPVSQVLLEAKIVEISTSGESLFAIDWLISSRLVDKLNTTITGPKFSSVTGGTPLPFTPGDTTSLPSGFSFGITNKDVNSLITALATRGKVKLIQAPKIMCLNGTNALISVTQNYPYIIPEYEETYNPQTGARTGTRQTVTVYEEEVGTEFEVTPIIQKNRTIFLNLNIYDSRLVEIKKLTAIAAGLHYETEQPIISTRETTQSVTLYDGQTLVIGGMIQTRKEKSETGVPFLRKIPILGYLFKKPVYRESSSELLLFLTPHIVTSYEEAMKISKPDVEKAEKEIEPGILKKF
ncbi:hypothetical protein J7L87_04325 [bacterium]|nr:hypothetical protein [bacterium]